MSKANSQNDEEKFVQKLRSFRDNNIDILYFLGAIDRDSVSRFVTQVNLLGKLDHCYLVFKTLGGDANAAYQLGRYLQRRYKQVTFVIDSLCKSAGTLAALAANEIVMFELAELGPLDVQTLQPDEMRRFTSGLASVQSLKVLQSESFDCFENFLLNLSERSCGQITTRTACEIASQLTTGLMGELYRQVDPVRLSESKRMVEIASAYGVRLVKKSSNLRSCDALKKLISEFPDHEFVIDRDEAKELFINVRGPSENEKLLSEISNMGRAGSDPAKVGVLVVDSLEPVDPNVGRERTKKKTRKTTKRRELKPNADLVEDLLEPIENMSEELEAVAATPAPRQ